MLSQAILFPWYVTEVLSSRQSGRMLIHVSVYSVSKRRNITQSQDIANYTELCVIEVDLSHLPLSCQQKHSGEGTYYSVKYDIVLLLGLTEFKAAIAWQEDVGFLILHWFHFY